MIRTLLTYLKARYRMIGRCPPHRYEKDGQTLPFCVDCGEYRSVAQEIADNPRLNIGTIEKVRRRPLVR